MCEATVLVMAADGEHVLIRDVMQVRAGRGSFCCSHPCSASRSWCTGALTKIDLLKHRIYVTPLPEPVAA